MTSLDHRAEAQAAALERAREELIDLTNRSRLLNVRLDGRANQLRIERERSRWVYERLVGRGGHFGFVAVNAETPPSEGEAEDGHLSTTLDAEALGKRLLRLHAEDRTTREETGVGSLHLALGFLRWIDRGGGDVPRIAPLVLVPVQLERTSAAVPFRLRATQDELPTNLSLQTKLRRDWGIELPDAPDGESDDAAAEFAAFQDRVAAAVSGGPGFELLRDEIVLGFFSFAKFLMWRDLDPAAWPGDIVDRPPPTRHPLVGGVLMRSFATSQPPLCGDDDPLDPILPPERSGHVVDADSSQAQVVAEAIDRRRSLVVQGPPGTGKSQTITNIVAAAVRRGLRVLFVAEKLAALSVVKSRLDAVGLGPACLELHSTKATRRGVLDDLSRTLDLGRPKEAATAEAGERLRRARELFERHGAALHRRDDCSGRTLFEAIGELSLLESLRPFPRTYACDGIELLDATTFDERCRDLEDLARLTRQCGLADAHPWRGCGLDTALPSEVAAIPAEAAQVRAALTEIDVVRAAVAGLGLQTATLSELDAGLSVAELLRRVPACDKAALVSDAWESRRPEIRRLADDLGRAAAQRCRLSAVFGERALAPGAGPALGSVRDDMAPTGGAWLRFLMPRWRRAMATLRSWLRGEPPAAANERLALLDDAIALVDLERSIAERDALGTAAFGSLWSGRSTDAAAAAALARWCDDVAATGVDAARVRALVGPGPTLDEAHVADHRARVAATRARVEAAMARWRIDSAAAFGCERADRAPIDAIRERVSQWQAEAERLREWLDWRERARRLSAQSMDAFVRGLAAGTTPADHVVDDARHARHQAVVRRLDQDGAVLRADGEMLRRAVAELCEADESLIRGSRAEVARSHHDRVPASAHGEAVGVGQVAVIRRESAKQRRHLPIRRLLAEAGEAVQAIKPVFMMSPLSVARFLEPGQLAFDVLVVDEASQVRPVEALGALARLAPDATLVVVGDQMQLPPTSFFAGEDAGGDVDESGDGPTESLGDMESLLGACEAAGLPRRMLRWHYRSRHHSLITVSNREFYERRLCIIPSPSPADETCGLRLRRVSGGVYDRGGSRTNQVEARAVAEAVMRHARSTPDLTLGVAAFSVQQRDAIVDEIEALRREDPSLEEFFAESGGEPFFVKNLENVQGDERDVILVSVGYGRDQRGQLTMNFGPVSASGGERRLNVLMTRAKRRCEIFTSLRAEDIDLARARGGGPRALREFLAFAAANDGGLGLDHAGGETSLERSIAQTLTAAGYPSDCAVGVAGTVIDVAVRDPRRPGAYLLAIETDGLHWRTARAARDRDRIRPTVLADRGWCVTRVWASEWWLRRARELERLIGIIRGRLEATAARVSEPARASGARPEQTIEREARQTPQELSLTEPYREAEVQVPRVAKAMDLDDRHFIEIVGRVIEAEGPIHMDELARRTASLFRMSRVSPALAERVSFAARQLALPTARCAALDGEFVRLASQERPMPRRRDEVRSATLRDPSMIAPAELIELLVRVAEAHAGVRRDEIIAEARRQLGFGSTGARLREALESALMQALSRGWLIERGGSLLSGQPRE